MRAALLVCPLLVACAAAPTPRETTAVAAWKEKPVIKVERHFVSNKVPAVRAEWLEITLPSRAAGAAITATLERDARASAKDFIAAARDAKKDEPRDLDGMPSADLWELRTSCRTTALRPALVSVRCDEYTYIGGAHGMEHALARTWGITGDTATELTLDDLLIAPYVDVLDKSLIASLRAMKADWIVDGSMKSVAKNLHTWNVTKEGLQFAFDPYEVGSYAQGVHEVVVGWNVLNKIRRIPGPLDAVAKD